MRLSGGDIVAQYMQHNEDSVLQRLTLPLQNYCSTIAMLDTVKGQKLSDMGVYGHVCVCQDS